MTQLINTILERKDIRLLASLTKIRTFQNAYIQKTQNNSCEIVLIIKQFYIREILRKGPTLIAVFTKAKIVQNMCFSSSEKYKRTIQWLS